MLKTVLIGLAAVLVLAGVAAPLLLAPGQATVDRGPLAAVDAVEQAAVIDQMRPDTNDRPVVVIVARNDGTEVGDFLLANGVLRRADVADVVVVAERAEPVALYPANLTTHPDLTMAEFDTRYPDGADYLVIPAMDRGTDPAVAAFMQAQFEKGSRIVSICNGSRMTGTAGFLDGRRATGHWSAIAELLQMYQTMQWVPDRRYVTDDRVTTSTGITAAIPVALALVEAIGGRDAAAGVAEEIGVDNWDARHRSADFALTTEHKKTFIRNAVSFWRKETLGLQLADGMDEIALGLTLDAWQRTQLTNVVTVGPTTVTTAHGMPLHPQQTEVVAFMLPSPTGDAPATVIESVLPRIVDRYDVPTAEIVALQMEYPWSHAAGQLSSR